MDRGAAAIGVTYAAFYDFLNCLEISPCASWLNSNETYRDGASARAVELNQQYVVIINEYTYVCLLAMPERRIPRAHADANRLGTPGRRPGVRPPVHAGAQLHQV